MISTSGPTGWRGDIEGLRALAIVPVVLYHLDRSYMTGGYLGVDLFLVISGYLIARMLLTGSYLDSAHGVGRFLQRRFLRIMPALAVTVAVFSLVFAFVALPSYHVPFFLTGLASLFGVSNFQLARLSTDYFAPAAGLNPFLHTWSVSIEDQFYTCFVLLLAITTRIAGRRRCGAVIVVAALVAVEYGVLYPPAFGTPSFFSLPLRAWEFLLGAAAFVVQVALGKRHRAWPDALRWAGMAGIIWSLAHARDGATIEPLLVCLGGASLCLRPEPLENSALSSVLAHPLLRAIGRRSFSIYLVHFPLLNLIALVADTGRHAPFAPNAVYLAVTALAAELLYRGVERPYVKSYREPLGSAGSWRPRGGALWAASVACGMLAILALPRVSRARTIAPRIAREGASEYRVPGAREVILLGDSHAEQFNATFNRLPTSDSVTVLGRTAIDCMASEDLTYVVDGITQGHCQSMVRSLVADVQRRPRGGRMVLLAIRTAKYIPDRRISRFDRPKDGLADSSRTYASGVEATQAYLQSLERLVEKFAAAGVPVLFLAPLPEMRLSVYSCYLNRTRAGCRVPRAEELAYRAPVMEGLRALEASHPTLRVWDLFDALCPGTTCGPFNGDTLVFSDDTHISAEMAALLVPELRRAIARTMTPERPTAQPARARH